MDREGSHEKNNVCFDVVGLFYRVRAERVGGGRKHPGGGGRQGGRIRRAAADRKRPRARAAARHI